MAKAIIDNIVNRVSLYYPHLKRDIRIAHAGIDPKEFIYKSIKLAFPLSLGLTVLFFFVADKLEISLFFLPLAFVVFFFLAFNFAFLNLRGKIIKRKKQIDREVLFAGQYLLVKLYSGKPLLNALIDTTKSYGVAAKYFKEIVDDIDTGSSLEEALESAMNYSPSSKFRKILFHINNALRLGIDVTKPLRSVLEEIAKEQEFEIKRYGKKLNTFVIFYMLGAVVIPSVGMTLFIVLSSFINFSISLIHFGVVIFFMVIIEFLFMSTLRTMRPSVNL